MANFQQEECVTIVLTFLSSFSTSVKLNYMLKLFSSLCLSSCHLGQMPFFIISRFSLPSKSTSNAISHAKPFFIF